MNKARKTKGPFNWKLWVGLLVSTVFLYLAFGKVDLVRTWEVTGSADLSFLILVISITLFQFVIRAWRWRIFLRPVKKTGFLNRFLSTTIGFTANCILPARLGEFIRANYIGQRENISRSSSLGTLVVERLFDGFTLLLILVIGLVVTEFPENFHSFSGSLRAAGLFLFLFYLLAIIFIAGFRIKKEIFLALIERVLFFISDSARLKFIDIIDNFEKGLVPMNEPRGWVKAVFYSIILWLSSLFQIKLVGYSIGLEIPFAATFLIMSMASLGVIIPSGPGFIGTFHLAVQYAFLFFGIPREEALSAAIIWHATFFFPTIFSGGLCLLYIHFSGNTVSMKKAQA